MRTAGSHVLVLNMDWNPLKVVKWEDAVLLLLGEKAEFVSGYVGKLIHSASTVMEWPAVIRLNRYVDFRNRMRFNRQNVLARDGYTCAYCGRRPLTKKKRPNLEDLTIDHVIPRAHAKANFVKTKDGRTMAVTCWENVVTSCVDCNSIKADQTPEQAGFAMKYRPRVPSSADVLRMSLVKVTIPTEWMDHLPTGSEWRNYWTTDLEES